MSQGYFDIRSDWCKHDALSKSIMARNRALLVPMPFCNAFGPSLMDGLLLILVHVPVLLPGCVEILFVR